MAITGIIAFGYLLGHMGGNLLVFLGQGAINGYAESLHAIPAALWAVRIILILAIVIHIWIGIKLAAENSSARPVAYTKKTFVKASLASRTMWLSGLTILAFLIYHLLHFTVRVTSPEFQTLVDSLGRPDVYSMVVRGFSNYALSAFYIIAVFLTCFHLSHGISSMFQSLGINNPRLQRKLDIGAMSFSAILFLGFSSVPVAVMLGYVTPVVRSL